MQSQHPNIVQVFEFGKFEKDSRSYFIDMELCDENLQNYISGKSISHLVDWISLRNNAIQWKKPEDILGIADQIIDGLIFIHDQMEVHRDLTPNNGKLFRL